MSQVLKLEKIENIFNTKVTKSAKGGSPHAASALFETFVLNKAFSIGELIESLFINDGLTRRLQVRGNLIHRFSKQMP